MGQTTLGTGLTPRNELQRNGARIGGNPPKGNVRSGMTNNFRNRPGSQERRRATEVDSFGLSIGNQNAPRTNERVSKKHASVPRKQISNLRPQRKENQPVNANQIANFIGPLNGTGMSGVGRGGGRGIRATGPVDLANCGLIANSIPLDLIDDPAYN